MAKTRKLTNVAIIEELVQIITGLEGHVFNLDAEQKRVFHENITAWLDAADEDDVFGSEGWRHVFLGE